MNKQDKDYLDEKLDNIFVNMELSFGKFSSAIELKLKDVNAGMDITHIKMDQMIKHQKETNGRVCELENNTIRIPRKIRWRVASAILIIAFAIGLISAYSYHNINWRKTFENKTDIELNTN